MRYSALLAVFLAVVATIPANAQEREVHRQVFTFLDRRVTVEVLADMPGTLRVVRGEAGMIDVAARVPGGLASAALGGRSEDNLRLTALGGEQAEFVVVVPEDVYLRIRLPGDQTDDLGSTRPGGTFTWPANGTTPSSWGSGSSRSAANGAYINHAASGVYTNGLHSNGAYTNGAYTNGAYTNGSHGNGGGVVIGAAAPGPMIAHAGQHAPRLLDVSTLNAVRTITVRVEPGLFQVGGNRLMSVVPGNPNIVEVRTGDESEDLVIAVPADTRDFTLKLGGRTALVMQANAITAYCEPLIEQQLSGGRRWFTFSPEAGHISCR